jgi:hypothetical protein
MLVEFSGQATSFGALAPGLCFAFEREGRPHIGLKVRDEAGGAADPCVVLWAEGGEGPALLAQAPPADCPVLALPDALVQPALDPAHIQTEGTGQREAGQLLLAEDRWLLVVGDGGNGTALIDLKTGARIRDARDAIRIRFRAWRIVQKGLGDEYDTICRHVVRRQSKVGFARG